MFNKLALASALALALSSHARAFDSGQYKDVAPEIRDWFKAQRSPNGVPCCDLADGHQTKWRGDNYGNYEVFIEGQWQIVPQESIIYPKDNPVKEPVVWYSWYSKPSGRPLIRCFVVGFAG